MDRDVHAGRTTGRDRVSGLALVFATSLSVFAMAHHPASGASGTAARLAEMARGATLSGVVHGALIALMLVIFFGLLGLCAALGFGLARVRAAVIAYAAGVICMLGAALVSGFVVPALAGSYAGSSENLDALVPVFSLCFRANQALAEVGVVAQSTGIFFWSWVLVGRAGWVRAVGGVGLVAGAVPVLGLFSGQLDLDVRGMLAVVVLQAAWTIAVGVWLIRGERSRTDKRAASVGLLAVCLAGALAACTQQPEATRPAPTRGYILVSLDTLGAKHLSGYGYPRETSPFLDRLGERGVVFENAVVQYPSTLVSHTSMFTGLYPREHGVYPPFASLSPEIATLPERFQSAGFTTAGITEGGFVVEEMGFGRGFDRFEAGAPGFREVEKTFAKGVEFLRSVAPGERFFLFLHTYSVHDPYVPPEEYAEMFWQGPVPEGSGTTKEFLRDVYMGRRVLGPEALAHVRSQHDALIRYTDSVLEGFVQDLEALGLGDEVTLVITSDHGEEFLEHGKLGHFQVYPETIFVPLIVVHPRFESGRRVETLVESVDLAPTFCELAELACPEPVSGESLVPLLTGPTDRPGTAYAEVADQEEMRTLLVQEAGSLHQVLTASRIAEPGGTWFARSIRFDAEGEALPLRLVSFARPRKVTVTIDGLASAPKTVGEEWQEVTLDLGSPGRHTVELATDGCDVPLWLGRGNDSRCLSLKVDGARLFRAELYDLTEDHWAARDLSVREPALLERLLGRLEELRFVAVAEAESVEPSEATSDALRALGYID